MWIRLSSAEREKFKELLAFPERDLLLSFLRKFSRREDLFIVGGAVRDFLLGNPIYDLDLAVKRDVEALFHFFGHELGYKPVNLSEEFGIFRLAKEGFTIDLTSYRGDNIKEDLAERDFTFNALALPVKALFEEPFLIFDPFGGVKDLKFGWIRALGEENIKADPLRILRGYRFFAKGYGKLEPLTRKFFRNLAKNLLEVAPERISMELRYILLTSNAYSSFRAMYEDGVFEVLFPEFKACIGLPQPSFHHLSVFEHLLEALRQAELILCDPTRFLDVDTVPEDFTEEDFILSTKLGSLFHDLGKGYTFERVSDRITFYGHELEGARLWDLRAKSLRFKGEIIERVKRLIKNHMRPCHLLKEKEEGRLTLRAKRNLIKDQPNLYELWVVALADSLASKGPEKEPDYEERLNNFFKELLLLKKEVQRVEEKERLLTGHDLIALGFTPGPIFKVILEEVRLKTLEGEIRDREQARAYVLSRFGANLSKQ